ncbi:MAG: flagellar biosynthetic protein FliQ [Candidatus Schekmanbacteria bacterium]|nr:MAG: flagellar biosynthetic protein FliQ [Candidatus Schekmanbacteria bacterium]
MSPDFVITISVESLKTAFLISAPMLFFGLAAGLLISIFQAVTQINEMTLAIVPKIIAVAIALVIFGSWMIRLMIEFTSNLFINIPTYIK